MCAVNFFFFMTQYDKMMVTKVAEIEIANVASIGNIHVRTRKKIK